MVDTSSQRVLDVRATCCPYPQLKTKVALDQMKTGEILKVLTDDSTTADNIRLAVEQLGDTILSIQEKGGDFTVIIQKSDRSYKSALGMKLSE
ncbi:sulfurtransferase TusA family protein [Candidatus Bathyarchaeota archaeon]|nr:sulfurtransferase TusA family protein [Candidatus Bathyarchaeota archaeon]